MSSDTLDTPSGDRPMSSSEQENKQRERKIAENEAERPNRQRCPRQHVGDRGGCGDRAGRGRLGAAQQ